MSGKHCPDCRGNVFAPRGDLYQCQLCGWTGDVSALPNSAYQPIFYERLRERYNAVLAGKVFIVRVLATKEQETLAAETLSKMFDMRNLNEKEVDGKVQLRVTLMQKPTKEQFELLAKTGKVSIFPD